MAVGTGYPFLSQLERTWYMTRVTGATPQMPLNQIKRMYWTSQTGGAAPNVPMNELETRWMTKYIGDGGGNPDQGYYSDLWREMVRVAGVTPSDRIDHNKKIFYSTVAS